MNGGRDCSKDVLQADRDTGGTVAHGDLTQTAYASPTFAQRGECH